MVPKIKTFRCYKLNLTFMLMLSFSFSFIYKNWICVLCSFWRVSSVCCSWILVSLNTSISISRSFSVAYSSISSSVVNLDIKTWNVTPYFWIIRYNWPIPLWWPVDCNISARSATVAYFLANPVVREWNQQIILGTGNKHFSLEYVSQQNLLTKL